MATLEEAIQAHNERMKSMKMEKENLIKEKEEISKLRQIREDVMLEKIKLIFISKSLHSSDFSELVKKGIQFPPTSPETMEIIDKIAKISHEQWVTWAKEVMRCEVISNVRKGRWKSLMVPYEKLRPQDQQYHRIWACELLKLLIKEDENGK